MTRIKPLLFTLVGVASLACSGDTTEPPPAEPTLTRITISPSDLTLEIGQTQQLSAQGTYSDGSTENLNPTWSSSAADVASISVSGLVTAVGVGVVTISASFDGLTGSGSITVTGSFCEDRTEVLLAPGEHMVTGGDECLLLRSRTTADYYRIAVTRPIATENAADVHSVIVETRRTVSAAGPVVAAPAGSNPSARTPRRPADRFGDLDGSVIVGNLRVQAATRRAHMRSMEEAQAEFGQWAGRIPTSPVGARTDHLPAPPARRTINSTLRCSASSEPHLLIGYNDHISVYQDSARWAVSPMSTVTANELTSYYESAVAPMIADNFGAVSDIDGNGRIVVTTASSLGDSISGLVWTGHFLPKSSCAGSNVGEYIFLNDSIANAVDDSDPGWFILGTLAHEAQHIVALHHRLASGQDLHPNWIEEGRAEVAAELSSRYQWAAEGGPEIDARVDLGILGEHLCTPMPCEWRRSSFALVNQLAGAIIHLSTHPNSLVVNPDGAHQWHSIYASGWHATRFLADGYGEGNAGELLKLLSGPTLVTGIPGIEAATGRRYDEMLTDLIAAMSFDGSHPERQAPRITSYELSSITQIFGSPAVLDPSGEYPWPVTAGDTQNHLEFGDRRIEGRSGPSGFRFHDFQATGINDAMLVRIAAQAPTTVVVARIR